MDNQVLFKFCEEIRLQCRFAELAWQNLRSALNATDPEKVFLWVHAFLDHARLISRFLWPQREGSRSRGETLRQELKIAENIHLRLSGTRRVLEQFDESFEDWIEGLEDRNYIALNVMPQGPMADSKQDRFHRNLDPEVWRLQIQGHTIDLRKLDDEIRTLARAIDDWKRSSRPW